MGRPEKIFSQFSFFKMDLLKKKKFFSNDHNQGKLNDAQRVLIGLATQSCC